MYSTYTYLPSNNDRTAYESWVLTWQANPLGRTITHFYPYITSSHQVSCTTCPKVLESAHSALSSGLGGRATTTPPRPKASREECLAEESWQRLLSGCVIISEQSMRRSISIQSRPQLSVWSTSSVASRTTVILLMFIVLVVVHGRSVLRLCSLNGSP